MPEPRLREANGRFIRLSESATAERTAIRETGPADAVASIEGSPTRRKVTIIQVGWGSSGYYSKEVLERDGPRVFSAGTHMYVDHPTESEEIERPERSVTELAAKIVTTPIMEGKRLTAEAEVYAHWAPVINNIAEDIGTSIRAFGESIQGEAEGRKGPIITKLTDGLSVDFVTHAGAGGEVGALIESAIRKHTEADTAQRTLEEARNAANWLEARIHRDFTLMADMLFGEGYMTREERIGLSAAIGEALQAFGASVEENLPQLLTRDPYDDPEGAMSEARGSMQERLSSEIGRSLRKLGRERWTSADYVFVEDFDVDDNWAIFCVEQNDEFAYYRIGYGTSADGDLGLVGEPVKVERQVSYTQVSEKRGSGRTGKEESMSEKDTETRLSELEEKVRSQGSQLQEAEDRATKAETRADRAEEALLTSKARGIVSKQVGEIEGLSESAQKRAVESVMREKLPVDDEGELLEDTLKERAGKAAKKEQDYLAEHTRTGRVSGNGQRRERDEEEVSEADLSESFGRLGMSDDAAKRAARGR